jgi:hypothetical protein
MYPIETDGGLYVAGEHIEPDDNAVVASLEQLFTGLRVGLPSLTVQCCWCGTELGVDNQVSVYAYRTVETPRWHLVRYRCLDCAPDGIETPTLGATEVCVRARLAVVSDAGTQQHRLCLADPKVTADSYCSRDQCPYCIGLCTNRRGWPRRLTTILMA